MIDQGWQVTVMTQPQSLSLSNPELGDTSVPLIWCKGAGRVSSVSSQLPPLLSAPMGGIGKDSHWAADQRRG